MSNPKRVVKAVIPTTGFGTRMLPATKAVPKEMLFVAGKPLIQHAVEEAAASGIETVILVVRGNKSLKSASQIANGRRSEYQIIAETTLGLLTKVNRGQLPSWNFL